MKTRYQVSKPTYDIIKSWDYNYDHGPNFKGHYPPIPEECKWEFLGYKLISPLGVAAGPLPNAKWLTVYAKLGYGSFVQKTVRSKAHHTHPHPNIVQVNIKGRLDLSIDKPLIGQTKVDKPIEKLSITNSFGNPSHKPKIWMKETKKAKKAIKKGQVFGVSVYGTQEKDTSLKELAQDYAKTALLAKKSGAMFIEANLACPNVLGSENPVLYKDPQAVAAVAKAIKSTIGKTPLVLKIGYFDRLEQIPEVIKAAEGYFQGISAINTIPKKVVDKSGRLILPGREISGVCGHAIKEYGIRMVKELVKIRKKLGQDFEIIGVGGVMTPQDVVDYLKAGADHVQSATAAMWNPYLAYQLHNYLESN